MAELVVALDFPEAAPALALVKRLDGRVPWMKIGLELFCKAGPSIVGQIKDMGVNVFLDLKFHDIPNTVYGAVRTAAQSGADMLTLHCSGGEKMLQAAVRAKQELATSENSGPTLLGVTALTSLDNTEASSVYGCEASKAATNLAQIAMSAGLDGVVCSALEVALMKKSAPPAFVCLTPGIRLGNANDDQARISTPENAVRDGSDYLVVGRPITKADDPIQAAEAFLRAMN